MATRIISRKPTKETIDRFYGLNLTGETQLTKGESPDMTNCYITDNYDLDKMYGYKQMMKTIGVDKPIQGMWQGIVNGTSQYLFACNGHIYKVTNGYWDDHTTWEVVNAFTTHVTDLGILTDTTTRFFDFENKVYFVNGNEYKYWAGKDPATATMTIANPCVVTLANHGYTLNQNVRFTTTGALPTGITAGTTYYVIPVNTNTFRLSTTENGSALVTTGTQSGTHTIVPLFSNVEGYIPKIRIGCKPLTAVGTDYEAVNQLTGKKRITYNGNATAVYQIPETSIASVDYVYVGGVLKTVTTHYTVNLTTGVVTFTTGNLPAAGLDNVEIYWTKANNDRTVVTKNRAYVEFKNRIFLYGNSSQQNVVIWSNLANTVPSAEYFPTTAFQPAGAVNTAITDIRNGYDRLVITKPNRAYFMLYDVHTTDGVDIVNFPTYDLNDAVGNVAFAQGQVIDNYPVTLERGIQQWVRTDVKDEKNANDISMRIKLELNSLDLTTALTVDFNERNEYWIVINKTVYIYNYGLYGYENKRLTKGIYSKVILEDTPTCISNIKGEIYFGTSAGTIMKFNPDFITFNGTAIEEHWESGFMDFGANYLTKTLDRVFIGLEPQLKSQATINYISNIETGRSPKSITYHRQVFQLGSVNFGDFSFALSTNPQPKKVKLNAKKWTYIKITIDNISATETCKILNLTVNIVYGGESK